MPLRQALEVQLLQFDFLLLYRDGGLVGHGFAAQRVQADLGHFQVGLGDGLVVFVRLVRLL